MSGKTYANNASNRASGRAGMSFGSCVQSRSSSSTSYSQGSSSSSSGKTYADNASNRSLGRVDKPVGSHVVHRDGSATVSSLNAASPMASYSQGNSSSSSGKTYVDNAPNRSLDRVGKPVGSHVVHQDGSVTVSSLNNAATSYADNYLNRKIGRVGKEKGSHVLHKDGTVTLSNVKITRDLLHDVDLDEIARIIRDLDIHDPSYPAVVRVQHEFQRRDVEEMWKQDGISPFTDITEAAKSDKEIIPLDEIELKKKIGEGGFGKVYAGLWKKKIPIAFKKFIYQQITKKQQDMLVKEIKIFLALDHANIVKMFGVVVEKDNLGIVMEYLPKTLYHAIFFEEAKFDELQKRKIVREVVSALEYLHSPNDSLQNPKPKIAHCDVKGQNILLDSKNVAKLCDFGLSVMKNSAQISSSHTPAVPAQGTPRYAAPEVLRGEFLSLSELMMSDIYSLSLVIYEILVEEVPFENLSILQLIKNVGNGSLRPLLQESNLSEATKQLLVKSWNGEAIQRPNIQKFSEELSKIDAFFT